MHILSGTMSSPDDSDLKFIEFVRSVSVTRNNNIDAIKKTNTRIGSKEASILGRTLSIPAQEDYKKFLRLYARDILRPGKKEYYTEELEKSSEEKMRSLQYQKYYTGGSIVLMFLVLIAMYFVLK